MSRLYVPKKVHRPKVQRKVPNRHGRKSHTWRTSDMPITPEMEAADAELDIRAA